MSKTKESAFEPPVTPGESAEAMGAAAALERMMAGRRMMERKEAARARTRPMTADELLVVMLTTREHADRLERRLRLLDPSSDLAAEVAAEIICLRCAAERNRQDMVACADVPRY